MPFRLWITDVVNDPQEIFSLNFREDLITKWKLTLGVIIRNDIRSANLQLFKYWQKFSSPVQQVFLRIHPQDVAI